MFRKTLHFFGFAPFLLTSALAISSSVAPPSNAFGAFCEAPAVVKQTQKEFHQVVKPLADLISKGEGDYNAVNRGYAGDTPGGIQGLTGLTFENYTVGQVMDMQRHRLFAVGRYQFIPVTLRFAVAMSDVDRLDMFTPETQDKLFAALLLYKRPAVGAYIRGNHDHQGWALNELAKEWASVEYRYGRGFYDHIGGNRAHITRTEAASALEEVRADYSA
jgi:hypothetical protein